MELFWYQSCLGSIYSCTDPLDDDELHCNRCGDEDEYIGLFETEEEAINELYKYLDEEEE